jgi:hypothetical protein
VLVQPQARQTPAQNAGEGRLARLDRLAPQVRAVQLEQVEGIQEDVAACALATKPLEHREPILVAGHGLAVDQARADLEPVYSFADERIVR